MFFGASELSRDRPRPSWFWGIEPPWDGNDMDTYADDLAALTEILDLKDAIRRSLDGRRRGGPFIGRHGTKRVAKAVLISAVPPLMLKTRKDPARGPIVVFNAFRARIGRKSAPVLQGMTTVLWI